MATPKFAAQIGNVYFLAGVGSTLRLATTDIAREELPPEIQRLLRRLDRVERKVSMKADNSQHDA